MIFETIKKAQYFHCRTPNSINNGSKIKAVFIFTLEILRISSNTNRSVF